MLGFMFGMVGHRRAVSGQSDTQPPAPSSFFRGRDPNRDNGTVADFYVNGLIGSDVAGDGSAGNPYASLSHALAARGGSNSFMVMGDGHKYREKVSLISGVDSDNRTEVLGYGTDEPVLTGAEVLSGFVQCSAADADVLGPTLGVVGSPVYKASIPRASAVDPDRGETLNIHEADAKLLLALDWDGKDKNDPFMQQWMKDYHVADVVHLTDVEGVNHVSGYTKTSVTNAYTQAQIERMWLFGYRAGNWTHRSEISAFNPGTGEISLETTADYFENATHADKFALFNALPNMKQGQWGYVVNGSNYDVYVYPNNPANLASGIEYSVRDQIFAARGISNVRISGIAGVQTCGTTLNQGCFYEAADLAPKNNVEIKNVRMQGHMGSGLHGTVEVKRIDDFHADQIDLIDISGLRGINFGGYVQSPVSSTIFAYRNWVNRVFCDRVELTPIRGTGLRDSLVTHPWMQRCAAETHNNKMNFYQQCMNVLVFGPVFVDVGGYFTWQESSAISSLFGYFGGDARATAQDSATNDRTYVDQNAGEQPADYVGTPDNALTGIIANCLMLPSVYGLAGVAENAFAVSSDNTNTDAGKYDVLNNCVHGYAVERPQQIEDWFTNHDFAPTTAGKYDPSDTVSTPEATFMDPMRGNFRIRHDAPIRSLVGSNLTAVMADLQARFAGIPFTDWTLDCFGDTFDPAFPPIGPSVNYRYAEHPGDAPSALASGDWSVATGNDAGLIALTFNVAADGTNFEYTTDGGTTWLSAYTANTGTVYISKQSTGVDFVPGASHDFDVRVANDAANGPATGSTKSATVGTLADFAPTWVQWPATGEASLQRVQGIGSDNAQTQVTRALTFRLSAADLSGNTTLLSTVAGTNAFWNVAVLLNAYIADQIEDTGNIRRLYRYTNSIAADTDYLLLQSFNIATGTGAAVLINIATGAVVTLTDGGTAVGAGAMDLSHLNWVIGSNSLTAGANFRGRMERVQQWDGVYVDVTQAAVQDYFYDAVANELRSPTIAPGAAGLNAVPPVNISGANLLNGSNNGDGGDFSIYTANGGALAVV